MPVYKFRSFDDLQSFERQGKGITWYFKPTKDYFKKALKFKVKVPFPPGVYKFKSFKESQRWEMDWWIKSGVNKHINKTLQRV